MENADEDGSKSKPINSLARDQMSLGRRLGRRLESAVKSIGKAALRPIARLLAARGLRVLAISHPDRIGHLAIEPDWYLKQVELGERSAIRPILLLSSEGAAANSALLDIWRRHMDVIAGGWRYKALRLFKRLPELTVQGGDGVVALAGPMDYARVLTAWGDRPPLVTLSEKQERAGRAALEKLGMPDGAWFVCMHVREGGYSPGDEIVHSYRNADISTYKQAAREIASRGGWVVRMGDATMTPLPGETDDWPQTVDYALSEIKSAEADVFLCANARFFLGNTSGLMLVSSIFGVPAALVNMIPYSGCYGVSPRDISIPKLLERDSKPIGFPEIFGSEIGNYRVAELYHREKLTVIDNTADEIHAVASEMLDRLDGNMAPESEEEAELQRAYRQLIEPSHYCYHCAGTIGRAFLRKHSSLLGRK